MSETPHPWQGKPPRVYTSAESRARRAYLNEWKAKVRLARMAGVTDPQAHGLVRMAMALYPEGGAR